MKFKVGDIVRRNFTSYHSSLYGIKYGDTGVVVKVLSDKILMVRYFKGPIISNVCHKLDLVKPNEI
jgi:hypothetical protein